MTLASIRTLSPPQKTATTAGHAIGLASPVVDAPLGDALELVDHLLALPIARWLEIGKAADDGPVVRQASERLQVLLATDVDSGAAWRVNDAVETALFLADRRAGTLAAPERRALAAAHCRVRIAAFALLARGHLSALELETLVKPVALYIDAPQLIATPVDQG